ncbi:MAG: acetyl-CoA C-acetyltransferase, partial [Kiloniellaceae bacterium]
MTEIVIAGAARTPVGAFNGGLSGVPASYLGTVAIKEAMSRAKVDPSEVDEAVLGQILTAGTGQNAARQAAVSAGIPVEKTAYQINQLCGS